MLKARASLINFSPFVKISLLLPMERFWQKMRESAFGKEYK
jgi:hypothetical protein